MQRISTFLVRDGVIAAAVAVASILSSCTGAPSGTAMSISITPVTTSIGVQATVQFRVVAVLASQAGEDVTDRAVWATDNISVAALLSGAPGLVTGITPGTTTVRASYQGLNATAMVTVTGKGDDGDGGSSTDAGPPDPGLLGIGVSPKDWQILVGASYQLTATGSFEEGDTNVLETNVVWSSSDTTTASVDVASGVVTGVAVGTATITAAVGSISGSTTVEIVAPAPSIVSVTISPRPMTLAVGATQQLSAAATYSDGTSGDVTSTIHWATTPTGLATVSATGLLTGVSPGDTAVSATAGLDSDDFPLTVISPTSPPTLTSISLSPGSVTLSTTWTQQLVATAMFSDGTMQTLTAASVTWMSMSTAIATVSSGGLISAVSAGTTTVNATYQTKSASVTVTVGAATGCAPVINEVQPGQKGASTNEFIELYNPCAAAVDTTGWIVSYHSTTGSSDISLVTLTQPIPASAFVVLGYKDSNGSGFTGTADYTYKAVSIASGSGGVKLTRAGAGAGVADTMSYGTQSASSQNVDTNGSPAPYGGDTTPASSVARKVDGVSTQNNSVDFAETSTPTPGVANVITP